MSDDQIDKELKEDVKKVFEKNSDNIHYVYDILRPDQKLNIKVAYNQEEIVYQKLLKSKKAAQIALNLYNANDIYKDLKILTESDLKNPCENEKPEDTNNSDLENERKDKSCNNPCSEELRVTNKSDSNNLHCEALSDHHDNVGEQKSDLENECKEKSCNNLCSEKSKVTNKSDSNNLCDEEPSGDHGHVLKSESSLPNSHNEEPLGESLCVDTPDKSEVIDKLYQYVFYFLIARNLEIINIYHATVGKERSGNLTCQFCDTDISSNDLECSLCKESLVTIFEKEIDKYERSKEIKNNKNRDTDSVANKEVINSDDKKHDKESGSQLDDKHGAVNSDGIKWKCKHCGVVNEDVNVNCTVCMEARTEWNCRKCTFANQISSEKCEICGEFREDKANNNNNNDDNREKDGRTESWTCCYRLCEERNDGNELYCKKCGLDKSTSRERGATVDIMRYGKIEQVWICCKCDHINYELNKSICDPCGVSKFHVMGESNNGKDKLVDDYEVIPSDNVVIQSDNVVIQSDNVVIQSDHDKWKCKTCQSLNDRESLSCKQCQSRRIEMWSCEHCTMRNQISDNHCVACGKENVNKTIKYCSKCKQKEIICDDLCEDCLKARDEIWICLYRLCENRNAGNVKYCQHCGLDRYADKINIGAPMWRCKGDVPVEIWICDRCFHINDISRYLCQNYSCCGENKYTKWCHKCGYKYNYKSNKYCEMCKNKFY